MRAMVGYDHGHDDCHRAGGAGNLGIGAAKDRGEEADGNCPVEPGNGAYTKSERQRQSNHSRN